jgi:hypothetical protein
VLVKRPRRHIIMSNGWVDWPLINNNIHHGVKMMIDDVQPFAEDRQRRSRVKAPHSCPSIGEAVLDKLVRVSVLAHHHSSMDGRSEEPTGALSPPIVDT